MARAATWLGAVAAVLLLTPLADAAEPHLTGKLSRNSGMIGGRQRDFYLYLPQALKPGAPLLIVFHGGTQDGRDIRVGTGFEFDMLADKYGFVVVYPNGINHSWNSCRKSLQRTLRGIDDVAFAQTIIANQAVVNHIDSKRVFVTGHSMGGAMSYRLGLEHPEEIAGIAVISSSLPAANDMGCTAKNLPIPVMIINGTADPVNPYRGGSNNRRTAGMDPISGSLGGIGGAMGSMSDRMEPARASGVTLLVGGRGPVMSTESTAQYWAKVNGQEGPPDIGHLPHVNANDPTSVDMMSWTAPGKAPVILYSILGGGHVVPQKNFHYPSIVGRQNDDIDAPEVIWDFFSRLPSRP